MHVKVYDHDVGRANDFLGSCDIDLEPLLQTNNLSLRDVSLTHATHGTIDVSIRFEQKAVLSAFPGPVAASAAGALEDAIHHRPSDATRLEHARDVERRAE